MIVILTQCFPSRTGGIETLISNLALGLSKNNKVIVFADRYHLFFDAIYDNKIKDHFLVRRISGLKFFRRRKKIKELSCKIFKNNSEHTLLRKMEESGSPFHIKLWKELASSGLLGTAFNKDL